MLFRNGLLKVQKYYNSIQFKYKYAVYMVKSGHRVKHDYRYKM